MATTTPGDKSPTDDTHHTPTDDADPGSPAVRLNESGRNIRLVIEAARRHGGANCTLAGSELDQALDHLGNAKAFLDNSDLDETVDPGPGGIFVDGGDEV